MNNRFKTITGTMLGIGTMFSFMPMQVTYADVNTEITEIDNQIAQLEEKLNEINGKLQIEKDKMEESKSQLSIKDDAIQTIDKEKSKVEEKSIDELSKEIVNNVLQTKTTQAINEKMMFNSGIQKVTETIKNLNILLDTNKKTIDKEALEEGANELKNVVENEKGKLSKETNEKIKSYNSVSDEKESIQKQINDLKNRKSQIIYEEEMRKSGMGIVETSKKYLGVPYVWGGTTPSGFDCSGLVQYVYAEHGVYLPRVTFTQVNYGTAVNSRSELRAGDLVFFSNSEAYDHVGIYIGNGQFLHAPSPGDVVRISPLGNYSAARRVL